MNPVIIAVITHHNPITAVSMSNKNTWCSPQCYLTSNFLSLKYLRNQLFPPPFTPNLNFFLLVPAPSQLSLHKWKSPCLTLTPCDYSENSSSMRCLLRPFLTPPFLLKPPLATQIIQIPWLSPGVPPSFIIHWLPKSSINTASISIAMWTTPRSISPTNPALSLSRPAFLNLNLGSPLFFLYYTILLTGSPGQLSRTFVSASHHYFSTNFFLASLSLILNFFRFSFILKFLHGLQLQQNSASQLIATPNPHWLQI